MTVNECEPSQVERHTQKMKLLNSLRQQYWKKMTEPPSINSPGEYVFDTGIQRFTSMQATKSDYFVGNIWKGAMFMCWFVIPLFGSMYMLKRDRDKNERMLRTGQVSYKDRTYKFS